MDQDYIDDGYYLNAEQQGHDEYLGDYDDKYYNFQDDKQFYQPTVNVKDSELDLTDFIKKYEEYVPNLAKEYPGAVEAGLFAEKYGAAVSHDAIPTIYDDWQEEESLYAEAVQEPTEERDGRFNNKDGILMYFYNRREITPEIFQMLKNLSLQQLTQCFNAFIRGNVRAMLPVLEQIQNWKENPYPDKSTPKEYDPQEDTGNVAEWRLDRTLMRWVASRYTNDKRQAVPKPYGGYFESLVGYKRDDFANIAIFVPYGWKVNFYKTNELWTQGLRHRHGGIIQPAEYYRYRYVWIENQYEQVQDIPLVREVSNWLTSFSNRIFSIARNICFPPVDRSLTLIKQPLDDYKTDLDRPEMYYPARGVNNGRQGYY